MKRIRFIPSNSFVLEETSPPIPMKSFIPEWYKAGEIAISKKTEKPASPSESGISGGLKSCIPFLDALVSGYAITSWEDIYVKTSEKVNIVQHVSKNPYTDEYEEKKDLMLKMIDERTGSLGHTIPRPYEHCENHMVFSGQWGVRLPKGWSLLVTHPLNRFDLPFTTSSGIMDSDEWWTGGNIPFFFKKNFEGIIPKGTPFAQIIPIKRSSWTSYVSQLSIKRYQYLSEKVRSVPMGWYRNNIWVKKKYD